MQNFELQFSELLNLYPCPWFEELGLVSSKLPLFPDNPKEDITHSDGLLA